MIGIIDTSQPISLIHHQTVKDLALPLERTADTECVCVSRDGSAVEERLPVYRVRLSIPDFLQNNPIPSIGVRGDIEFDLPALCVERWPRLILRQTVLGHRGVKPEDEELNLPRTFILGLDFMSKVHFSLKHQINESTLTVAAFKRSR